MTALSIIIDIILILVSLVLIVIVLMQEGQREGLGAIGGGAETFFGKNLGSSAEGKLKFITKIAAAVFIVLAIVATIVTSHIMSSNNPSTPAPAITDEVENDETAEPTEAPVGDATEAPADDATEEPAEATTEEPAEATAEPSEEPAAEPTEEPQTDATEEPEA